MSTLAHGPSRRLRWPWFVAAAVVVVALVAGGTALALHRHGSGGRTATGGGTVHPGGASPAAVSSTTSQPGPALAVATTSPLPGAEHVASNAGVTIRFSTPLTLGSTTPTLDPAVAGTWHQDGPTGLEFTPARAMVPYTLETVTVPGGSAGLRATDGSALARSVRVHFTVAAGSTRRLQELLAVLHYLPVQFNVSAAATRPARDDALSEDGHFTWRWKGTPSELTSLWTAGSTNAITKAAIMSFEQRNGLSVDGVAGPAVWKTLLANARTDDIDTAPYSYVLVTKVLPEHLELWSNGQIKFAHIDVNTGAPGADTTDGTYPVFEHVTASDMSGTNPDGSTYNDKNVPWASFFNHGDALHGFVRASYGSPQSNGCVEMPVATAARVWPYTPIGTLVTVTGPTVT